MQRTGKPESRKRGTGGETRGTGVLISRPEAKYRRPGSPRSDLSNRKTQNSERFPLNSNFLISGFPDFLFKISGWGGTHHSRLLCSRPHHSPFKNHFSSSVFSRTVLPPKPTVNLPNAHFETRPVHITHANKTSSKAVLRSRNSIAPLSL